MFTDSRQDELDPAGLAQLPEIPGGWAEQVYELGGRTFRIMQPAKPDAFLDDPTVREANRADDYMPYWSYLWPTSLEMATALMERPHWPVGTRALELGSGIGLVGVVAQAAGLDVTFSDYDPQSLHLSLHNAWRNGFLAQTHGLLLDWRQPVDEQFPVILGCDLIYEYRNHAPLLDVLDRMLAPEGVAWFADAGRHQADGFVRLARDRGYELEHRALRRLPFAGRPDGVTHLWIVTRPARG